ncbi:NYN domain-containing protein [Phaeosphaeriaceae sp. PMI808]|nr:NYN domain-containing protein [Phaeosphaeriaceae sp. PMI808]
MATETSGNLALLIDGDNVSPKIIVGLLAEIANYGTISVRRIYGDWTSPQLNGWKTHLLNHSIQPIHQFAYTTGKNSTDGAMIIDAMDLLYTGRFSGFCIVSSDSDFVRLAARIREQGVTVYGFGERKTVPAFIAACDKFVYFDVLNVGEEVVGQVIPQASMKPVVAPSVPVVPAEGGVRIKEFKRPLDQAALDALEKAINGSVGYDGNYANMAMVGTYLRRISPDLNARNYGYDRLKDFVEASGIVNLKWKEMGNNPPILLVSLKTPVSKPLVLGSRQS